MFHGNGQHLEYDFVVSPGADPAQIRLALDGADRVAVDAQGNLELSTPRGTMKQLKPRIWQAGPHGREEVRGRYVLSGAAEARFEVDRYDRGATLVIDPVIQYSTTGGPGGRLVAQDRPYGVGDFGQAGVRLGLRYDTRDTKRGASPWSWIDSAGSTRRAGASARLPATSTLPALMASTA